MNIKLSMICLPGVSILIGCSCRSQVQDNKNNSTLNEWIAANDICKLIDNYLVSLAKNKSFSGGLLIIKNGEKILSKGYGFANKEKDIPFTPSTLASMGSITKAFTAAGIMKLCEQGKYPFPITLKNISLMCRRTSKTLPYINCLPTLSDIKWVNRL